MLPHVLRVPPRLLPAQRRALRQQPHAGPRRSREEEGERRTENGAGAEPARRGVRSAPRQRRREPSPAPHVTAAARQAVTQHFPATGPAPLEAGAPPRPPRSASARGGGGRGRGLRWQIPLSAPRGKATMGESGDLPAVCEGSCPVTFREHPPNAARGVGRRPFSCGRPAEMAAGKRPPRSRGRPSPRPGSARVGGGGWWSGLAGCSRWKGTPG